MRFWIDSRKVWTFVRIAPDTRERQVFFNSDAAVLPRDDVLELKWGKWVVAILTPSGTAPPNQIFKDFFHLITRPATWREASLQRAGA